MVLRASWRYLWRHPLEMGLVILGVALGVAVVVAVDLANESARRAFQLSMEQLTGRSTHQIIGGPGGLPEAWYTRLRVEQGWRPSAPVVEGYGSSGTETLHLLGIDAFAETAFQRGLGVPGGADMRRLLVDPGAVVMGETTARRLGIRAGEHFSLEIAGRSREVLLVEYLRAEGVAWESLDGLVLADIATAQELMGTIGRLSWVDLILPEGRERVAAEERVRALLPPGATLVAAESRSNALTQMTGAFRTNLTAMSLLALVVGMFLIYNTTTFAVLQRRELFGTLRMVGVTQRELFQTIVSEAAVVGLIGTLLGLALGIVLGQGLVKLVTRTINDLYFVVNVTHLLLTPPPLLKGIALGLGATVLAALVPALEAARTPPQAVSRRSELETRAHRLAPPLAILGVALTVLALVLLWLPSRSLIVAFAALFMLIVGMAFITPLLAALLAQGAAPVVGRLFGISARLAIRGVSSALSRTGVAIAALMLAVATTVGVGVMIVSFRATVAEWLAATLQADIYVAAPSLRSSRSDVALPPGLAESLRALPGVAGIGIGRAVTVETETGLTAVLALEMAPDRQPHYVLKAGSADSVWAEFHAGGGVLVSEPYAYRHDMRVGGTVKLRTERGETSMRIVGIYYDYDTGPGEIIMDRTLYEQHYADRAVNRLALYLDPDADPRQIMDGIRRAAGAGQQLVLRTNRELRDVSLDIFDRTFTIMGVLRLLAILVAFVGILSALMALQLERAREIAVLRATGFTSAQVSGLVILQTGFMGFVAGILALPVGLILAQLLIHVINQRAFGWSMQALLPLDVLAQALGLSVAAAVIAGVYPGWKLSQGGPARALREE